MMQNVNHKHTAEYTLIGGSKMVKKASTRKLFSDSLILETIMRGSSDAIYFKDLGGHYVYVNQQIATENGIADPKEMIGKSNHDFFAKELADNLAVQEALMLEHHKPLHNEVNKVTRVNGNTDWISVSKSLVYDKNNQIIGFWGISRIVTETELIKEKLLASERKFRLMIENISDIIMIIDEDGTIKYISPNVQSILQFIPEAMAGKNCFKFVHPDDLNHVLDDFAELAKTPEMVKSLEFRIVDGAQKTRYVLLTAKNLMDDDNVAGILINMQDISERIHQNARIQYLSYHDVMTGLYNRSYFDEEKKRLDTDRQLPLSIIMGDVNGLKTINDTFGHAEGDRLLANIAGILANSCRREDIVARIGGDEYCILLPQTDLAKAQMICGRIMDACKNCRPEKWIRGAKPSIALGAATKTEHSQSIEAVQKSAEEAMYVEKHIAHQMQQNPGLVDSHMTAT
jgi:diguanylate cyclase (GGDEF)-like protein/PAS domain S-box-containing protein